ncbi:MAG TPA: hypothetical protein DEP70_08845 [Acholeplasmataceae bacterium]|nr:hypothetical protein [Acholeplasmataceae bacterium]
MLPKKYFFSFFDDPEHPNGENIQIAGLDQVSFEQFIDKYGSRFRRICLNSCKSINDLSPLSKLENLEYIQIAWNTQAETLWDMTRNTKLHTLILSSMSKMKSLKFIDTAPNLKVFWRGDGMWITGECESLFPLQNSSIEVLGFEFKKINDLDIEPLIKMKHLKELYCHPFMFELEQCVEFSFRRPDVIGNISKPYINWGNGIMTVGKRGRMFPNPVDNKILEKYEDRWNQTLQKIKNTRL